MLKSLIHHCYRFYYPGKTDWFLNISDKNEIPKWFSQIENRRLFENKQKFDKYDLTTVVEDIGKIFGIAKSELKYVIKEIKCNKKQYIALTLSIKDLINKIQNIKVGIQAVFVFCVTDV